MVIIAVLGVCLRKSARSARDIGVSLYINRVLLREYPLADHAEGADECSGAVLFRRERQFVISVVLGFVCVNLREILGFLLCRLIEYSYVNILPQIAQITQRNTAWLYYSAEKDSL